MREIKFKRAHFKDLDRNIFSHFDEWGVNINGTSFTTPGTNNFTESFADLQYTGLKDKNGKEIYEGDICNKDRENSFYEIVFYKSSWAIRSEDQKAIWHQEFCNGANNAELEVVGNIYEHGYLLIK